MRGAGELAAASTPRSCWSRRRPQGTGKHYSTVCTLNRFVPPAVPAGRPAVMPILSPAFASPALTAASAQRSSSASVSSGSSLCWAMHAPEQLAASHHGLVRRQRQHRRARPVGRDQRGRGAGVGRRDDAGEPELVHRAHGAERDRVVLVVGLRPALREPAPVGQLALGGLGDRGHHLHGEHRVAATAVSWESITASVPSKIAFATSVTSARVGASSGPSTRASGWP